MTPWISWNVPFSQKKDCFILICSCWFYSKTVTLGLPKRHMKHAFVLCWTWATSHTYSFIFYIASRKKVLHFTEYWKTACFSIALTYYVIIYCFCCCRCCYFSLFFFIKDVPTQFLAIIFLPPLYLWNDI